MLNTKQLKALLIIIAALMPLISVAGSGSDYAAGTGNAGFVLNLGQWDKQVRYLSQSGGCNVWIADDGITFDYYRIENFEQFQKPRIKPDELNSLNLVRTGQVIKMKFKGGSVGNKAVGSGKQNCYYNYFIGDDPAAWKSRVPLYNDVLIENVYDKIDAHVYYDNASLRYDFIVKPQADPSKIKIEFTGQNGLSVGPDGGLAFATVLGTLEHNRIYAYQVIDGKRSRVECSFRKTATHVEFELGSYDKSKELVIDPLVYSTFVGPSSNSVDQIGQGLTVSGNAAYITGTAVSASFPTTTGAYTNSISISNNFHVFVSKIIPDRTLAPAQQLVFSTFFGGKENEFGYDIVLDKDKDIYITGTTTSADFPISALTFDKNGGWNDVYNRKIGDGFIAKLSGDGTSLLYSTFMGEDRYFYTTSIDVDDNKMIYTTGYSNCTFFKPSVNNGFYTNRGEGYDWDAVIIKLDQTVSGPNALLYFSFYGGANNDEGYSIKAFDNGNVYVAGQTMSPDFQATGTATGPANGISDVYALKMDLTQSGAASRKEAYVFGGSSVDFAYDMTADKNEVLYITGYTNSTNFPVTANAISETTAGDKDIFISKIDFTNTSSPNVFSTYTGGKNSDIAYAITTDNYSNIYLTGLSSSTDFPVTTRAFQKTLAGNSDVFLAKINLLDPPPYSISYSSYIGGINDETGLGVGYMADTTVVISGITKSEDFPVSIKGLNYTGFKDTNTVFLSRLDVLHNPLSFYTSKDTVVCSNTPSKIGIKGSITGGTGGYTYQWYPSDYLDDPASANPEIIVLTDTVRTLTYFLEVIDKGTKVVAERKIKVTVKPSPKPVVNESSNTVFCQNEEFTYTTTPPPGVSCQWEITNGTYKNLPPYTGTSLTVIWNNKGKASLTLTQTDNATQCSDNTVLDIFVNPIPDQGIFGDIEVCSGCDVVYKTPGYDSIQFKWIVNNGVIKNGEDDLDSVNVTWNDVGEGTGSVTLIVTNKNTGCADTVTISVKITAMPKPTILGDASVCAGDTVTYSTPQKDEAVNKWSVTGGKLLTADDGLTVDVLWQAAGTANVSLNQKIKSKNYDETTDLPVTINDRPVPAITGNGSTGINDVVTYSVPLIAGNTYDWEVIPAAMGTVQPSSNGNQADVTWKIPGKATVLVRETNAAGCTGIDTLNVSINSNLLKINGKDTVCEEATETYSTISLQNTTINWTVTGGTITGGQGTAAVTVLWGTAGNGSLKATHTFTQTGTSSDALINVKINPKPAKPAITRTGASLDNLESSVADAYQWYMNGAAVNGATDRVYTPDTSKTAQYTVMVSNQYGCETESDPYTFGPISTSAELLIRANPATASDGDKVAVEIVLNNPKALSDANAAKSLNITLKMKSSILIPSDSKYLGTKSGDDRLVSLSVPIPSTAQTGQVLASFACRAALDMWETTTIEPVTITPVDGMITFTNVTDGEFTLDNVCHEGGNPRLVNSSGAIKLMNIVPNPAETGFEVEFQTIETGIHKLYLVNTLGNNTITLLASELPRGWHKQAFSTENIPSGAYLLVLETPYTSKYVKITVSK